MPIVPGAGVNPSNEVPTPDPQPTAAPTPVSQATEPVIDQAPQIAPAPVTPAPSKDYVQDSLNEFNQAGRIQVDESDTNKKSNIAIFSQSDQSPDDAARVYDLSVKMGLPADYIKDNMKEVQKESFNQDFSYDDYKARSPKFTNWMAKDQQNLPLVKDQTKHLSDFENKIKDYSSMQNAYDIVGVGLNSIGSWMGALPAAALESVFFAQNLKAYLMDRPDLEIRAPDGLRNNFIKKYYDDAGKMLQERNPFLSADIGKLYEEGNYSGIAKSMFAHAASNYPNILMMAAMPGASSMWLMGVQTAATSIASDEAQKVPAVASLAAGVEKGIAEAGFERLGSFAVMKKWTDAITKGFGKQGKLEIIKNFSKMLASTAVQGGTEEGATTIVQNITDYFNGVDPHALDNIVQDTLVSVGIGVASEFGLSTPSGIMRGHLQNVARNRSENEKALFLAIGESADQTNLKKKLPKKYQELASQMTKDGPVESFYMDAEAFDKHFETYEQGGIPGAIKALGIENEYNQAKETGDRIKIKTANWASSMDLATYAKTADDITFSHDGITTNENKKLADTFFQEMKDQPENVTAQHVEENLIKAGRSPEEAKQLGTLWDRVINRFSEKTGIAPETIFGPEGDHQLGITGQATNEKFQPTPEEVLKNPPTSQYKPEVLEAILNDSKTAVAGGRTTHNPVTGERIPADTTGPAYLMKTGYSMKDIRGAFTKKIAGEDLTPYQEEIVSKIYTDSRLDESSDFGAVTFFQTLDKAIKKIEENVIHVGFGKKEAPAVKTKKGKKNSFKDQISKLKISEEHKVIIENLSVRFNDKKMDKFIIDAQKKDGAPYAIIDGKVIPNFASELSEIGKPGISQPHDIGNEDQFAWHDMKYGATKEAIQKRTDKVFDDSDNSLVIHTSSDLVAHDNYSKKLDGSGTIVNMYLLTNNEQINRLLFPGNPSRRRQYQAVEKLKSDGVNVQAIRPTMESIITAVGSEEEVLKRLGNPEDGLKGVQEALGLQLVQAPEINIQDEIERIDAISNQIDETTDPVQLDLFENQLRDIEAEVSKERPKFGVIQGGKVDTLFQSKQKEKRGSIDIIRDQLGKSKIFNIRFLEEADRSTFLHESAHAFLEIFADLADHPTANQAIKDDWASTLKYLGVKDRSQIKKRHHEKWAESFEKYLFEGKAPVPELQDIFTTFQSWLVSVYKTIEKIYPKLQLNDSIRGVFDRMIASDEELERARAQSGSNPQFTNTAGVMLPEEAAKYQELILKEREKQTQMVLQKAMHDQTREYLKKKSERRREIKAQAEIDVAKEPEQMTLKAIREGVLPDGQTLPAGMDNLKINKKEARKIYHANVLETVPRGVFDNDGLHPNIVANILLGSQSTGAELIAQLAATLEFKDRVEEVTDQIMTDEFPDPIADGTIAKDAVKAVHDDVSLNRKQFEIDIMMKNHPATVKGAIKKLTVKKISNAQFKERAKIIIGGMQVRDINPNQFKNAERKNSNLAIQSYLKGDLQIAIDAKQKEILNGELYKLAVKIDAEVNKNIDKFSEAFRSDEKLSNRYNIDTFNAARSLLSYYGFGKSDKSPEEYLKYTKAYNIDIYNSVSQYLSKAMLTAKDYRDLTYNEFVDLSNSFFQIKEIAKLENEFTTQDRKLNKRNVIDNELIPQLKDVKGDRPDRIRVITKGNSPLEQISFYLGSFANALKRAEAWTVGMDNGKFDGPFRKYIFETVYNGVIKYRLEKNSVLGSFRDLLSKNQALFTTDQILATELPSLDNDGQPHTFDSMHELLGAIIHVGNLSNKRKLLVGNGWGSVDENGELDDLAWEAFIDRMIKEGTLTAAHFETVQESWNLMESIKKDAQAAHKELYGHNFEEITSNSFTNATGTYKGGYAPAITDKSRVKHISEYNVEISDDAHNWFPANPNGFTKARNENYSKPLLMDLRLVPNHVDAVLRFSHISVPVKNVSMLLEDRAFSDELDKYDPTLIREFLKPWLERSLSQRSSKSTDSKAMDYFLSKMRSLQGAGVMFANVMNTMQQYTGVLVATAKVDVKYLRNSTFDVIKNGNDVASFATEMSDFMKTKISFTNDHIVSDIQNIIEPPTGFEKVDEWFKRNAYAIQGIAQGHVDLIVWNGAYHQAVDQGASPKVAVQMADSAVRLTQGTFATEDVSSIESGNPLFKIFTMFYSYYNTIANLYSTELKVAMNQDLGLRKTASRLFFVYAVSFALPAILSQVMVMAMSGQPFDENDDDEYITDALKVFFMPQLRTIAGTIPGLGPIFNSMIAKFDKNALNDRISLSPIFQSIEKFKDQPFNMVDAYQKGKINKKKVQDALSVLNMTSLLPGVPFIPFQALSRPTGYLMDVKSGRARPKNPIDVVQGLLSGRGQR